MSLALTLYTVIRAVRTHSLLTYFYNRIRQTPTSAGAGARRGPRILALQPTQPCRSCRCNWIWTEYLCLSPDAKAPRPEALERAVSVSVKGGIRSSPSWRVPIPTFPGQQRHHHRNSERVVDFPTGKLRDLL